MDVDFAINGSDYHQMLEQICPPKYGLQVLEPGCGSGKFGIWYARGGAAVTLLDINPGALKYARQVWEGSRQAALITRSYSVPHFQVGSVHHLPFPDGRFDFVFNEGVANHFGYNPRDWRRQRCLNEMVRVTKPGGHICVMVDNAHCEYVMERARSTQHTYKGMPPRQKPFTLDELGARLLKAGLRDAALFPGHQELLATSTILFGWGIKP